MEDFELLDSRPRTKLDRMPLGRQIASVIRNDILYGRLKPGEQISQQQLCDQYGTSRMPVRDALRQLTYEGFVVDDGNRHALVAPFSRRDLEDIYLIEGMLHALAARRVVERGDKADLETLQRYHDRMVRAEREGQQDAMARTNWEFHRAINKMSRSPKLIAVLRTHSLSIPRDYLVEFPEWSVRANNEHEEILQLMWDGDADRAEALMQDHVTESGTGIIAHLEACGLNLE